MKKNVIRVAAFSMAAAMIITGSSTINVNAATASSVLPASGGILVTGNGVSLKDIKAERARSAAKQKAQEILSLAEQTKREFQTGEDGDVVGDVNIGAGETMYFRLAAQAIGEIHQGRDTCQQGGT